MSAPPVLTELKLSAEMKDAINKAFEIQKPIVVAYVDENSAPQISYRGSTQAYGDKQLAIWVRNPEGGIVAAVRGGRAHIALLYGEIRPDAKAFVSFRGRGRIDNAEPVRRKVYDSSPEAERDLDKNRKGVPLIIDLDSVDGFFAGSVLKMRR
jgi:hypothetical protein